MGKLFKNKNFFSKILMNESAQSNVISLKYPSYFLINLEKLRYLMILTFLMAIKLNLNVRRVKT